MGGDCLIGYGSALGIFGMVGSVIVCFLIYLNIRLDPRWVHGFGYLKWGLVVSAMASGLVL